MRALRPHCTYSADRPTASDRNRSPHCAVLPPIGGQREHTSRHCVVDTRKRGSSLLAFGKELNLPIVIDGPGAQRCIFPPPEQHVAVGITAPCDRRAMKMMGLAFAIRTGRKVIDALKRLELRCRAWSIC